MEKKLSFYSLYSILHFVQFYNLDLQPRNLEHTRKQSALDHFPLMYQKWRDKINKIKDKHRYFSHNWGSTVHTHTHTNYNNKNISFFLSFVSVAPWSVPHPPLLAKHSATWPYHAINTSPVPRYSFPGSFAVYCINRHHRLQQHQATDPRPDL